MADFGIKHSQLWAELLNVLPRPVSLQSSRAHGACQRYVRLAPPRARDGVDHPRGFRTSDLIAVEDLAALSTHRAWSWSCSSCGSGL